ncbi:MAG: hypothetical protein EPN89_04770 [Methylovulum sp.]|nr:MAG: hypothetical protein EPN89_04770 [Methylovulum sp.]
MPPTVIIVMGELLYQNSRWANADQLYGLSAECVLKRIIVGLEPSCVDQATGDFTNRDHKKHFEQSLSKDLWNHFSINFSGRLARHALPNINGFSDWDIFQRYAHERHFDQQRADSHRTATMALQNLLQELFTDGVIQ